MMTSSAASAGAERVGVCSLDPTVDPSWRELAAGAGRLFESPPWVAAVAETYGLRPSAHVVLDPTSGRPRSGVVTCSVRDGLGCRRVAYPFSDYCQPILADPGDWPLLLDAVLRPGEVFRWRTLGPLAAEDPRLMVSGQAAWHEIDLSEPADVRWAGLRGSARRNIRAAQRAGVTISFESGLDAFSTFFRLHTQVRKYKHHLLPQPWLFLAQLHEQFSRHEGAWVALAHHDGQPVAGILLLEWSGVAYYKFNASAADHLAARPNDLLLWETIGFAASRGNSALDLGLSDLAQPGLLRYKQKYATTEGRILSLVATADATAGSPPGPADDLRALLSDLTALFIRPEVPDHVTARAGELLYRYFA
jgi:CelD/BcsL family acetyltransferase involved in cellulose biosynthesis